MKGILQTFSFAKTVNLGVVIQLLGPSAFVTTTKGTYLQQRFVFSKNPSSLKAGKCAGINGCLGRKEHRFRIPCFFFYFPLGRNWEEWFWWSHSTSWEISRCRSVTFWPPPHTLWSLFIDPFDLWTVYTRFTNQYSSFFGACSRLNHWLA